MPPMNIRDLALLGAAQPSAGQDSPITAHGVISSKLLEDGSAWEALDSFALSGNMNTMGGSASNAISAMGGYGNSSYLYDGSADDWGTNIGCSYSSQGSSGGAQGSADGQDGAIAFGGNAGYGYPQAYTTIYDGSSWGNVSNLDTTLRETGGGDGNEDEALVLNGQAGALHSPSYMMYDEVEVYDGAADDWGAGADTFGTAWNNGFYRGSPTDGLGGMGTTS